MLIMTNYKNNKNEKITVPPAEEAAYKNHLSENMKTRRNEMENDKKNTKISPSSCMANGYLLPLVWLMDISFLLNG